MRAFHRALIGNLFAKLLLIVLALGFSSTSSAQFQSADELIQRLSQPNKNNPSSAASEEFPFGQSLTQSRAISSKIKAPDSNGVCTPFANRSLSETASRSLTVVSTVSAEVGNTPKTDLDLSFDFDSDHLSSKDKQQLNALVSALKSTALAPARFILIGHADASGSANYNKRLSCARALAAFEYLLRHKIDAERIAVLGYGSERLRNKNKPEAAENRRVEVRRQMD